MKRLVSLFFWFCTATVIAQVCILGMSYFRGNLKKKSMVQIIALLNGIDIPGERLKNAISAGQDIPVPTREEILNAKIESNLELDSREKAIKRWQGQLQAMQAEQDKESQVLAKLKEEHDAKVAEFNNGRQNQQLKDVQDILQLIAPDQAKIQILSMMDTGSIADVVAIIKGMPEDKRKKILAEFTDQKEIAKLGEIIKELRTVETKPVSSPLGDKANKGPEIN